MSEAWRVVIEEELDCETLTVYVGTKELGKYIITDDPQAERQAFVDMIAACVSTERERIASIVEALGEGLWLPSTIAAMIRESK